MGVGTASPVPAGRRHSQRSHPWLQMSPCLDYWGRQRTMQILAKPASHSTPTRIQMDSFPHISNTGGTAPLSSVPLPRYSSRLARHTNTKSFERKPASRRKFRCFWHSSSTLKAQCMLVWEDNRAILTARFSGQEPAPVYCNQGSHSAAT